MKKDENNNLIQELSQRVSFKDDGGLVHNKNTATSLNDNPAFGVENPMLRGLTLYGLTPRLWRGLHSTVQARAPLRREEQAAMTAASPRGFAPPINSSIVVIGGGPAGAMAALRLAAVGRNVVLIEREIGPHDKVCGEFLSAEAAAYLHQAGIAPRQLGAAPIRIVSLSAGEQVDRDHTSLPGVFALAPCPGCSTAPPRRRRRLPDSPRRRRRDDCFPR